ncbi:MAG: hypothetical protein GY950_17700 [bacterium]|nr:hypothetical protein [bacterium]
MKTKHILKVAVLMVSLLISTSCANSFNEVRLDFDDVTATDFDKYDKIVYADLLLDSVPKSYNPEPELKTFFLEDFSRITGKEITHLSPKEETAKDSKERIAQLQEKLKQTANTLLITGKLIFDIKSRRKIKEVENDAGKKEKKFVKVEHWSLTLKIEAVEVDNGKTVFSKKYSEKISDADTIKPKYNFETLFYKINNRFVKDVTAEKKRARRYLLY